MSVSLSVVSRAARTRDSGKQASINQLDVTEPREQVGQHDLTPVWMSGGKPLTHL